MLATILQLAQSMAIALTVQWSDVPRFDCPSFYEAETKLIYHVCDATATSANLIVSRGKD